MAIIWDDRTQSHVIRRQGITICELTADDFPAGPPDLAIENQIEATIKNQAAIAGTPCRALVHIFSRVPLRYVLRIAPPGYTPKLDDWWEPPLPPALTLAARRNRM